MATSSSDAVSSNRWSMTQNSEPGHRTDAGFSLVWSSHRLTSSNQCPQSSYHGVWTLDRSSQFDQRCWLPGPRWSGLAINGAMLREGGRGFQWKRVVGAWAQRWG
ncbi:hypothetical protein ElyMa_002394700 [Elysia marginata]|uniref:Uncharacterized protein n=1 Tax=Elysia marginata TaxID=1093978 RepID=A0AAV4GEY2_9GAST|nr:hypothetical protein ElyMa_002394700 [Elysia marginata]